MEGQELNIYATHVSGRQTFAAVQENYHVFLNSREITSIVTDLQMSEEITALSAELSFKVPVNPKDKYLTAAVPKPVCGDKIVFKNGSNPLFSGIVIEVGLDGTVKCNDYGFYLNKQEIIYQCNGVSATNAIKGLCARIGLVEVGEICSIPTRITKIYINQTPSSILQDIIDTATAEQGKNYLFKVRNGHLNVAPYPTKLTVANYRQVYGKAFDVTWLLGGVSGSQSISELRNRVVVISNNNDKAVTLAVAEDKASQAKYGVMQEILEIDSESGSAKAQAESKLKELNVVTENYTVDEMLGVDAVMSGLILYFSSDEYGLSGYYLVRSVAHSYCPVHTMSLNLMKVVSAK